jgi:hypothetical protein
VVVEATPQPSRQYGETVCVAGIDVDAEVPQWLRLYPVPFRYLEGDRQFKKYDIISVHTRGAGSDKRPESRKIEATSIRTEAHVSGWKNRAARLERLRDQTMCQLVAQPRPTSMRSRLRPFGPGGWTESSSALTPGGHPSNWLASTNTGTRATYSVKPPRGCSTLRLVVQLSYHCETEDCKGHSQRIIDWELTALQLRYRGQSDSELEAAITNNFLAIPFGLERAPMIFVGNQENITRRAAYTVLGLYYPKRVDLPQTGTLF